MTTPSTESEELQFEGALEELQQIVELLERGRPTLDESLARFERGVRLLAFCREHLEGAEAKVQELVTIDEAGNATLKPFRHAASFSAASGSPSTDEEEESEPVKRKQPRIRRTPPTPAPEPELEDDDGGLFG